MAKYFASGEKRTEIGSVAPGNFRFSSVSGEGKENSCITSPELSFQTRIFLSAKADAAKSEPLAISNDRINVASFSIRISWRCGLPVGGRGDERGCALRQIAIPRDKKTKKMRRKSLGLGDFAGQHDGMANRSTSIVE